MYVLEWEFMGSFWNLFTEVKLIFFSPRLIKLDLFEGGWPRKMEANFLHFRFTSAKGTEV